MRHKIIAVLLGGVVLLTSCSKKVLTDTSLNHTAFFDFTVLSVSASDEQFSGLKAGDGNTFVTIELQVQGIRQGATEMYYDDFELVIGKEAFFPQKHQEPEQLEDRYEIAWMESVQGNLIFIVPKGQKHGVLRYTEYYEDDRQGETFDVAVSWQN